MNLIKPKKLQPGDTIAIIAPSGNVNKQKVLNGKQYLESLGYNVKLGRNLFNESRYLAGSDSERISDLHEAFSDESVNAIICARGGYGALRLINKIDYTLVKNNPKIFCGYSDITILNSLFLKKSSLITFSAPMIQSDFASDDKNEFTIREFFNNLTVNSVQITSNNSATDENISESGQLIGGNLSTFVSLCGTDFLPDEKFIFFTEDLCEPVYKIDKYFTQLFNINKFKSNISAILLGDFLDTDDESYLNCLFKELGEEYKIPIISGFPFSHSDRKTTVPYGAYAQLSGTTLTVLDYLS